MIQDQTPDVRARLERIRSEAHRVAANGGWGQRRAESLGIFVREQADLALAALSQGEAPPPETAQGWQPRETAPDDGSAFTAYGPSLVHPDFNPSGSVEACFDGERFVGAVWDGCHDVWRTDFIEFTHWMRRPEPPTSEAGTPPRQEGPAAFMLTAYLAFIRGRDIPETVEAARAALVERVLRAEAALEKAGTPSERPQEQL